MSSDWESSQKLVAEVAPIFVKYIKELFFNDIGFGTGRVSVCDVKSSYKPQTFDEVAEPRGDRFRVLFPFGGRFVKWEVIFDWYHPDRAPDFLFSDNFMQKVDRLMLVDVDFLASWENWDHNDPKSLLYVLRSLLEHYKKYQVSLLEDGSRVKTEFEQIVSSAGISASDLEVLTGPGDTIRKARPSDKTIVTFLVRLPVDFSEHLGADAHTVGDDDLGRVTLFAEFYNPNDTRPTLELRLSPRAKGVLQSVGAPSSNALRGMSVHAAVGKATLWSRDALARIGGAGRQRAELLTALTRRLHPGLVELDSKQFLSATFLMEHEDFHLLLSVKLDAQVPGRKPEVHLQSVYHMGPDGQPLSKAMEDFPYASAWRAEEKAKRILNFCFEQFKEFKTECAVLTRLEPESESE